MAMCTLVLLTLFILVFVFLLIILFYTNKRFPVSAVDESLFPSSIEDYSVEFDQYK